MVKKDFGNQGGSPDVDAAWPKISRSLQEKEDRRKPDGAFAEYRGRFRFSDREGIQALPLKDAPNSMKSVFDGSVIRWDSERLVDKVSDQTWNSRSFFSRSLAVCLDEPTSEESKQVFGFLTDQVRAFDPESVIHTPDSLREWWGKISLLAEAYCLVDQKEIFDRRAFAVEETSEAMNEFKGALEEHMAQTKSTIETFDESTLGDFLLVYDTVTNDGRSSFFNQQKKLHRRKGIPIPREMDELMREASSEARNNQMDLIYMNADSVCDDKWSALQKGWSGKEVSEVISVLPRFQSHPTIVKVVDASEDALETGTPFVFGAISPEGLATFIHYDIAKNIDPVALFIHHGDAGSDMDIDGEIPFSEFSLPRDEVPVTSLSLFSFFARQLPEPQFETLLEQTQELIIRRKNIPAQQNEWLLLLTLLRDRARQTSDELLRQRVEQFIARDDFPHKPFQETFLDRKAGSIYLMDDGAVRVTDHTLAKGVSLYTAPYIPPEQPVQSGSKEQVIYPVKSPAVQATGEEKSLKRKRQQPQDDTFVKGEVVLSTPEQRQRRPRIKRPEGVTYKELGEDISPGDLALVQACIKAFQEDGRHSVLPLRSRTGGGQRRYKMRVNGQASGIRVVMVAIGGNTLEIESIQYRGNAYKDL